MSVIVMNCFARSGGTLLNQCLGCLPNVVILSEVNPLGGGIGKSGTLVQTVKDQAKQWYGIELGGRGFLEDVLELERVCEAKGLHLVLRDWTYVNFVPYRDNDFRPTKRLAVMELLQPHCRVVPFAFIRDPIDAYLSSLAWVTSARSFFSPYLDYVKAVLGSSISLYRYEDFCQQPAAVLQALCAEVGLPFADTFQNYRTFETVNGDVQFPEPSRGAREGGIKLLPRRKVSAEVQRELDLCLEMVEANVRVGYCPRSVPGALDETTVGNTAGGRRQQGRWLPPEPAVAEARLRDELAALSRPLADAREQLIERGQKLEADIAQLTERLHQVQSTYHYRLAAKANDLARKLPFVHRAAWRGLELISGRARPPAA